jgi:hypothetical protein
MDQGNEMSNYFRMTCEAWDDVIELEHDPYGGSWLTVADDTSGRSVAAKLNGFELIKLRDALIAIAPLEEQVVEKKRKAPHGPQEYKGNGKHEWEQVTGCNWRLRVPGGWLYRTHAGADSTTFVPTPAAVGYAV